MEEENRLYHEAILHIDHITQLINMKLEFRNEQIPVIDGCARILWLV